MRSVLKAFSHIDDAVLEAVVWTFDCIWETDQASVMSPTENGLLPVPTKWNQFSPQFFAIRTSPCWSQTMSA